MQGQRTSPVLTSLQPLEAVREQLASLRERWDSSSESYRLSPADTVEVSRIDGALLTVTSEYGYRLYGFPLPRARIPALLLVEEHERGALEALRFSSTAGDEVVELPGGGHIDSWSTVRSWFKGGNLQARLIQGEPARCVPGESVVVNRVSRIASNGPDNVFYGLANQFEAVVDHEGRIALPPLSNVRAESPQQENGGFAGAISASHSRLRVWSPDGPHSAQPTLGELTHMLSSLGGRLSSRVSELATWAGVDSTLRPPLQELSYVRYDMAPARRSWTLVDEVGRRIELPYAFGQPILCAAHDAYRRLVGRELLRASPRQGKRRAHLTIMPGPYRQGPGAFHTRVDFGRSSALEDLMVLPGDVVFTSRERPLRARGPQV